MRQILEASGKARRITVGMYTTPKTPSTNTPAALRLTLHSKALFSGLKTPVGLGRFEGQNGEILRRFGAIRGRLEGGFDAALGSVLKSQMWPKPLSMLNSPIRERPNTKCAAHQTPKPTPLPAPSKRHIRLRVFSSAPPRLGGKAFPPSEIRHNLPPPIRCHAAQ